GELCSEDDKGNSLVSESYHYNDMGSLLSVESHYANGGYSEMVYQYNNDYPDRLVSYSKDNTTYTFSYDQMGNMVIDDQGSEIHYNGFGRIDQVIQGAEISDYYYNGLNELVSVKNNNHYEQYLYSQLGLMGVDSIDSTNNEITSTQRYLYAGSGKVGVFNQSKDNQASYQGYIKDYAGSILALVERTDEAVSDIVQSYRYTPYGEITKTHTETNQANRLGYNGELTDNATSWQLLGKGTRAYNPRIRQFTSQDTWSPFGKGGINRYAYLSQANPVMYSDPSGHMLKALKARFSNHNSNQNTHAQRLQLEERSMSKSLFHTQSRHSDVNIEEYQRYIERRVNRTRNVGVRDPVQVFSGITFRVDQREPEHIFVHGFNQDYEAYTGGEFFGDRYGRTNSRGVSTSRQYTIVRQFANQRNMRAWTYVLDLTEGFHAVVHNNSMAEINSNGISSDRIMGVLAGSMYFKNPNYDGTQRHPDHEDLWN
ncbi:RHS repeat-associated core domain-containing protein, partial [Fangia hongkongensis]